jgi:glycosyltransferase involved in cell wall biosynthesis
MSASQKADVVVPVYRGTEMTLRCLGSVLAHGGPALRSLIVVNDHSPEPDMHEALARIALTDSRVRLSRNESNLGFVATCNRGLAERRGDAVLLNSDTIVTPGWLDELAEVVHSDARTACASPLSNFASLCSVPVYGEETTADRVDERAVRLACAGLPRWTEVPTVPGFCIYLSGMALDLVGLLDARFSPGYNEENDWVMRAQAMGFVAKRANHAFVYHLGSQSFGPEKIALEARNAQLLAERYPHYRPQVDRFHYLLDGRVAAHAVRVESSSTMRVALDLRDLPPDPVGTGTYAICLARALAAVPEVELSLIVRNELQATGIPGRVVWEQSRLEDVEIIHKPAQVFDPVELRMLFQSPAHVVITHLDLIAHRAQGIFPSQAAADRYRATSALALQAAQSVIAISEDSQREIAEEFALPSHEIAVTPLGVDHDRFARRSDEGSDRLPDQVPPGRFLLSIATDLPHKNINNLIEAYALVRTRWMSVGEPPKLILVSSAASIRNGVDRQLPREPSAGIVYVGAVNDDQLRVLYHRAEALVFASSYEGFGLPILEAMTAGTPVVALPLSSVPEVGGDAVLYAQGTSPTDLAAAIERLTGDPQLRDDLRARGPRRAQGFRWEKTARLTAHAYRSSILRPSERSLRARRQLQDVIVAWAQECSENPLASIAPAVTSSQPPPSGIRSAWRDLSHAVHARVRRDIGQILWRPRHAMAGARVGRSSEQTR